MPDNYTIYGGDTRGGTMRVDDEPLPVIDTEFIQGDEHPTIIYPDRTPRQRESAIVVQSHPDIEIHSIPNVKEYYKTISFEDYIWNKSTEAFESGDTLNPSKNYIADNIFDESQYSLEVGIDETFKEGASKLLLLQSNDTMGETCPLIKLSRSMGETTDSSGYVTYNTVMGYVVDASAGYIPPVVLKWGAPINGTYTINPSDEDENVYNTNFSLIYIANDNEMVMTEPVEWKIVLVPGQSIMPRSRIVCVQGRLISKSDSSFIRYVDRFTGVSKDMYLASNLEAGTTYSYDDFFADPKLGIIKLCSETVTPRVLTPVES